MSFILESFSDKYNPPATIHPLMMMVAGLAFGSNLLKERNANKQTPQNGEANE